jgi:hypothetical protein
VDVKSHRSEPLELVRQVRNWFVETAGSKNVPTATRLWERFLAFTSELEQTLAEEGVSPDELHRVPVPEYVDYARQWASEQSLA